MDTLSHLMWHTIWFPWLLIAVGCFPIVYRFLVSKVPVQDSVDRFGAAFFTAMGCLLWPVFGPFVTVFLIIQPLLKKLEK